MEADINSDVTVCVTTIDRPYCAQRFIRSVRARYPRLPVILVSQGEPHAELAASCAEHGVVLRSIEYDAGVTVARRLAVGLATSKYLLFCDDDFIFGSDTDLDPARRILEANESIDILGGLLIDIEDADLQSRTVRRWETYLFIDEARRTLLSLPIDACAPQPGIVDGHCWFDADMVLNWKLVRRDLFDRFAGWDTRYHCNGEHEDFYLAVKARDDVRVAYTPSLTVYHHIPRNIEYRKNRERQLGWVQLGEKWQLENYINAPAATALRRFSHGQRPLALHDLNHQALIANGTAVTEGDGSPGSGTIDAVVTEFQAEQLADPDTIRLRLAGGELSVRARPGEPLAVPVVIDSPVRFGCSGATLRPRLACGTIRPGTAGELDALAGRTPLMQDVCGSTLQYVNVTVPLPPDPLASGVDLAIRLWSEALGYWGQGVTMRIDYQDANPAIAASETA